MQKLRISDNNRYFVRGDAAPFIWLADTVWTMPQRLKWDDIEYYMQKRISQGFTVLQIVALDPERDEQMRNPAGIKALHDHDLNRPNEAYFQYLDAIIKRAGEYGFYILLLPVWGQLVVGEDWGGGTYEKTVTAENAGRFGAWIGNRYKEEKHIIWCLGGDRQPIHGGCDYRPIWREMAEGLARGVTGTDVKYHEDSPVWKELLITYHACYERETGLCSTMSYWTDEDRWISFIMLQSGHGKDVRNEELVRAEYQRARTMPVWDGEPAYEMMPTNWPEVTDFHGTWIVRKRAYQALLSGAFGHTYGHASVWCSISEKERNRIAKYTWYEALNSEGAGQMKILRDFMEAMKLHECIPIQDGFAADETQNIPCCVQKDGKYLIIYLPHGGNGKLNAGILPEGKHCGWWFNPRDGKCVKELHESTNAEITAPSSGEENDWIYILTEEQEAPVKSLNYGEIQMAETERKVFDW